jgi:hypothetical protein
MSVHTKNRRADKIKVDAIFEDKTGVVPRLNELIRLARFCFYGIIVLAMILGALFLMEVVTGLMGG